MCSRVLGVLQASTRHGMVRLIILVGIVLLLLVISMFEYSTESRIRIISTPQVSISHEHVRLLETEMQEKLKDTHVVDLKYQWDKAVWREHNNSKWSAENQLQQGLIPPNIHFMWCGEKVFEYRDYLSVLSVLRSVSVDKITIHLQYRPIFDKLFYHRWLDYLRHDVAYLVLEQMDEALERFCEGDRQTQIELILKLLNNEGGIYMSTKTWLLSFPPLKRKADFEFALEQESIHGYIMMRKGIMTDQRKLYTDILSDSSLKTSISTCGKAHHLYKGHINQDGCLIVGGRYFEHFFPKDIWELNNAFGRLARRLFYGTEEIRKPVPSYDELVPNIGHMVWMGGGEMDFVFYLSLLSMLFVVKVDVVYIHGDFPPAGPHWDFIEATPRIRDRVKLITRTPPDHIFGGVIEPWYLALMSDLIRVDLMIKYGGIYTDTDAIWVKPLTYEDRGYDAVASYDWVDWSWPYPDSVNFGLSYGKKNAPFWQLFRESMRTLHNDLHGFTGVMNPYKILERYPHLLRIDRHLQVICYQSRCHPIWVKDYHNMNKDHVTHNTLANWRKDVNALHWTHPNPVELKDEATLRNSTGLFADVGKLVLEAAGLW